MFLLKAILLFGLLSVGFAVTNHADQAWMIAPIMMMWGMFKLVRLFI